MHRHKTCKKRVVNLNTAPTYCRKIIAALINSSGCPRPPTEAIPTDPVNLSIVPTVNRYFYVPITNINLQDGATLPASLFYTDDGEIVEEFVIYNPNGYVDLYINAVMQEGGFYTVDSDALTIVATAGIIFAGTPIIIESVGFNAVSIQSTHS